MDYRKTNFIETITNANIGCGWEVCNEGELYVKYKSQAPAIIKAVRLRPSKKETAAHREQRAQAALQTALWAKQSFKHHGLA